MIQLKGIKRNTPAGLSEDGELEEAINLRYKDGAWRPVPERTSLFGDTVLPYTNVFIHSNSGYKHYLGLKSNGEFEYFAQDVDGTPEELETPQPITTLITPTFTQLGNVININDNGLKHLIWYDSSYILIDANFDGEQTDTELIGKVELKVTEDLHEITGKVKARLYEGSEFGYDTLGNADTAENRQLRADNTFGLLTKGLSKLMEDGKMTGFRFGCTAIELYDGSYILHSNPVLLGQLSDVGMRYETVIDGENFDYINNKAVLEAGVTNFRIAVDDYFEEQVYYNLAYKKESSNLINSTLNPSIVCSWRKYYLSQTGNDVDNEKVKVVFPENVLKFKISSDIDVKYQPLIKSIGIFLTLTVDMFKSDKSFWVGQYLNPPQAGFPLATYHENHSPVVKTNAEIIKELSELKNFYKVHEIPFEDINAGGWTTIDLKGKLGDSLATQEALTLDNFTHHQTLPEVQFMYNSKLHVLNYKTALSRGWPITYFYPQTGIGQFQSEISEISSYTETIYCFVDIKTPDGTSTVIRTTNLTGTFSKTNKRLMLSYPDSRATRITIYTKNSNDYYYFKETYDLKSHIAGNFAYYINPDLKPDYSPNAIQINSLPTIKEVQRELIYQNTLKVSEVNNPFTFPLANTYQIGNGQGLAMAVNTIALSTGQFGQWPLYVFCSDGIYGLSVGGAEVNYGTITPVSREVCNNPQSVKSIDAGVIFTTIKGAMILAGSDVQELSEALRGPYFDIDTLKLYKQALSHSKLTQLYDERTNETLLDFMDNVVVGLNYKENEVWFTNPDKTFSYVFSKGVWFKVKQSGQRFVDDYPNQYLLKDGKLIDIGSETGTYNEVTFLTRPLKLGQENFKGMLTSIIRGQINVENTSSESGTVKRYAGIHVYGSYDGKRWAFLGGNERNGELNSFGTQVERTDCKFFKIAFYGNVNINSTIDYLLTEGKQSILSNKER